MEECETALAGIPHDAETHLNYAEALEEKSEHCHFCFRRWIRQSAKSEYEAAAREAGAAIDFKRTAEAYFFQGRAYYGWGDYEEAETKFAAALELKANYPKAHYYQALAQCKLGKLQESTEEFRLANEQDSSFALLECSSE